MEDALAWLDDVPLLPDAILDAGNEAWVILGHAIRRRLNQMAVGETLEVVSADPRARADIPTWCLLSGHELIQLLTGARGARFWIRKGGDGS
jgi:tRNA 2-thiouridine synthesizing protein A